MNNFYNLKDDLLNTTIQTAIACYAENGRGDNKNADQVAVSTMRHYFNKIPMQGKIVIGEGERDKAPMLFIGEKVGQWHENNLAIDIAVDPLEGTNLCAKGKLGALTVLAAAPAGKILHAPDVYMEKIVWGPNIPQDLLNITDSIKTHLINIAEFTNKKIQNLKVIILERERHQSIIEELRSLNVQITLIEDGDIEASLQVALGKYDLYLGSGGAPEGVIAAAALKSIGGGIQGRLIFKNDQQIKYAKNLMKSKNINDILSINDMIQGEDFLFIASSITGAMNLKAIEITEKYKKIESLLLSKSKQEKILTTYNS